MAWHQGRRAVGGGPGPIFFRGPYLKKFSGKNFFRRTTSPPPPPSPKKFRSVYHFRGKIFFRTSALQFLSRDFISLFYAKFPYLAQITDILSFARKYLTHKNHWGPTKFFWGPPAPPGPGQFPPPLPPLSAALRGISIHGHNTPFSRGL